MNKSPEETVGKGKQVRKGRRSGVKRRKISAEMCDFFFWWSIAPNASVALWFSCFWSWCRVVRDGQLLHRSGAHSPELLPARAKYWRREKSNFPTKSHKWSQLLTPQRHWFTGKRHRGVYRPNSSNDSLRVIVLLWGGLKDLMYVVVFAPSGVCMMQTHQLR